MWIFETHAVFNNGVLAAMITGWLGLFAAAISPGPNMFAVVASSLGGGLAEGLQVNLGIAIGALIWASLANLGLAAFIASRPDVVFWISLFGGSYLLFLAYKGFRSAVLSGSTAMIESGSSRPLIQNILHGLAVTFSNPKVALFWASISVLITSVTTELLALVIFSIGASLVVFTTYGAYAVAFSTKGFHNFYMRFRRVADGIFGLVFSVLAFIIFSNGWAA